MPWSWLVWDTWTGGRRRHLTTGRESPKRISEKILFILSKHPHFCGSFCRYDPSSRWVFHLFCHHVWKWFPAIDARWHPAQLGWPFRQWLRGQLRATMGKDSLELIIRFQKPPSLMLLSLTVCTDIRAAQDCGVHLPHGILRQYRGGAVGGCHHLQDQTQLSVPAGHEVSNLGYGTSRWKKAPSELEYQKYPENSLPLDRDALKVELHLLIMQWNAFTVGGYVFALISKGTL